MRSRRVFWLATLAASVPTLLSAAVPPGYARVAREYSVPAPLLYAIARAESQAGFSGQPWPWTLNAQGKGHYFVNRDAATQALRSFIAAGIRNVDIGLMQVNWRWHEQSLLTADLALDPIGRSSGGPVRDRGEHGNRGIALGDHHGARRSRGSAPLPLRHRRTGPTSAPSAPRGVAAGRAPQPIASSQPHRP